MNHNANVLANEINIFMKTLQNHKNYRFAGINGIINDLNTLIKLMGKYANIRNRMIELKYEK